MSQIDLWYTTRATGIVALVLLSATVFLGVLVAGRARGVVPAFARAELHKRLSVLSVVFVAIHVLSSLLDSYVDIGWLAVVVPFTSSYGRVWVALGTVGLDLLLAVVISSALRQHLPQRAWRALHWLAYLSWPVATAHALGLGTDTKLDWMLGVTSACITAVGGAVVWRAVGALRAAGRRPRTLTRPRRSLRPATGKGLDI